MKFQHPQAWNNSRRRPLAVLLPCSGARQEPQKPLMVWRLNGRGMIRQGSPSVSRRTLLRALGVSGGALTLGGCASLGASETVQFYSSRIAANPTVLAATTRRPVSGGRAKPWYGTDRGTLSIARVRL